MTVYFLPIISANNPAKMDAMSAPNDVAEDMYSLSFIERPSPPRSLPIETRTDDI
jgi:hypothetical protein